MRKQIVIKKIKDLVMNCITLRKKNKNQLQRKEEK